MKKNLFLCLGLLGLMVALVPTTIFAATSSANARTHKAHFFFQKSYYQNQNRAANSSASADAVTNPFSGTNLTYHGGSVMDGTMHVYLIFWQPDSNAASASYQTLIQRYFNDVGGSALYQLLHQYTDSQGHFPSGVQLADTWTDTQAYPSTALASTVFDSDIQAEVTHAQQVKGWVSDVHNMFFVFTERNENVCYPNGDGTNTCTPSVSQPAGFCAYHSYIPGTSTIYASMPYAASSNFNQGCNGELGGGATPNQDDADLTINVLSHEQIEAATDPLLDGWYYLNLGGEIGDKCAWDFGPLDSTGADVNWNGHHYLVQQEWSNALSSCSLTPNVPSQYYQLVDLKSHLVLDVSGASKSSGAQLIQSTNHNTYSQRWSLVPNGDAYQLVNRNSGLVLTVSGASTSAGANLVQQSNHDGNSQRWWLYADGPYSVLVNTKSFMVARPSGGSASAGAHIVQDFYQFGATSEQWALVPVYYTITNVNSGLTLSVAGNSTSAGANVVQVTPTGSFSEQWTIVPDGSNYQILNRNGQLVLTIFNASTTAGANIVQQTNHNGASQQWNFLSSLSSCQSGNACQIKSVKDGFVLDVSGASTSSGAQVIQEPNTNTSSQQWIFTPFGAA